jgi:hypothetical protein
VNSWGIASANGTSRAAPASDKFRTAQLCAPRSKHLHRYLAEYDFRYSNRAALGIDDNSRAEIAANGIVGKRLTYRRPNQKDIPF